MELRGHPITKASAYVAPPATSAMPNRQRSTWEQGRAGGRVGGAAETCLPGVTRSRRTTSTSQLLHYHHLHLRLHHLLLSRPY